MGWRVLLLASLLLIHASASQAQAIRSQTPLPTRLVQLYSGYEQRLAAAIRSRNTAEIDRLVAKDFELRSASNIGVPVPRADWVAQSLKDAAQPIAIEAMAVHDYGDVRVVSFVMQHAKSGRDQLRAAVVDVWLQTGEEAVLKTRYASLVAKSQRRVPGETMPQHIEKRY